MPCAQANPLRESLAKLLRKTAKYPGTLEGARGIFTDAAGFSTPPSDGPEARRDFGGDRAHVSQGILGTESAWSFDSTESKDCRGPAGNTRTIKVMRPEKLQGVNVGDTVDITYTKALAIKVEKAPKK